MPNKLKFIWYSGVGVKNTKIYKGGKLTQQKSIGGAVGARLILGEM